MKELKDTARDLLLKIEGLNHPFTKDLDSLNEKQLCKLIKLINEFVKNPW